MVVAGRGWAWISSSFSNLSSVFPKHSQPPEPGHAEPRRSTLFPKLAFWPKLAIPLLNLHALFLKLSFAKTGIHADPRFWRVLARGWPAKCFEALLCPYAFLDLTGCGSGSCMHASMSVYQSRRLYDGESLVKSMCVRLCRCVSQHVLGVCLC